MRYLRTNTATIVTVGPFYDKTDGVTIETGLTITNERITFVVDLNNGSAPTLVLDNVTGATSGTANDLNYITNCDAGLMQLELAAADVNYFGRAFLTVTDAANHCPVFHEFTILPANVYDALVLGAGTDLLDVNVAQISEDATAADNAELMFDGTGYAGGTTRLKADVDTIKTQAVTCAAGVTVLAQVGAAGAPGAANGVLIAGTNAPVTITGSGNALTLQSTAANGHGLFCQGQGSGSGLTAVGAGTGNGIYAVGDDTGMGILAVGGDAAAALTAGLYVKSTASTSPVGLYVEDGAVITSDYGDGLSVTSTGGNGDGISTAGNGTGLDINSTVLTDIDTEVDNIKAAVEGIAVTGAAMNVLADGATVTLGTESSGTYASTSLDNGTYHVITAAGGGAGTRSIDLRYTFTLPNSTCVPTQVKVVGYLKEGAPAGGDSVSIEALNSSAAWEVLDPAVFTGITTSGPDSTMIHALFSRFVTANTVTIRFYNNAGLEDGTTLNIDQVYVSYAEAVSANITSILADTNELQTDWANGGRLDLILDATATAAELAKVPKSDSNVSWNATALAAINAEVDTALNTAIPGANTANSINDVLLDQLGADWANGGRLDLILDATATATELAKVPKSDSNVSFNATALAAVADAVHDEQVDGTVTHRQSQRIQNSASAGVLAGAATATVTIKDLANTKTRITATVDADGNRSAVTLTDVT